MNDIAKQAADFNNLLYGLPGDTLLGIFAIMVGFALKLVPPFPNKYIPLVVVSVPTVLSPLVAMGTYDHAKPMFAQVFAHIAVGSFVGGCSWLLHNKGLKRIEAKIPFIGKYLVDEPDQPEPPAPVDAATKHGG